MLALVVHLPNVVKGKLALVKVGARVIAVPELRCRELAGVIQLLALGLSGFSFCF